MVGIAKSYPGVRALDGVDLELHPGEVHALLGENGAGKSTLIGVLAGAHGADEGVVELDGRNLALSGPADAAREGISVMHQEFMLVPGLSARENIFLGAPITAGARLDHEGERARTRELFGRLGASIDPDLPVSRLSVAEHLLRVLNKLLYRRQIVRPALLELEAYSVRRFLKRQVGGHRLRLHHIEHHVLENE